MSIETNHRAALGTAAGAAGGPRSVLLPGSITNNQVLPDPNERARPAPKAVRRRRCAVGGLHLGDVLALSSGGTSNPADVRDVAERRSPVTPTTSAAGFFLPTAGTPAGAG